MPLTVAAVENQLLRRCDDMMTACRLDSTTRDGTNADLAEPIRLAVRAIGYTVADVLIVVDSDLVLITDRDVELFLDQAELRICETCLNKCVNSFDYEAGREKQRKSQMAAQIRLRIDQIRQKLREPQGVELTGPATAKITGSQPRNPVRGSRFTGWPAR